MPHNFFSTGLSSQLRLRQFFRLFYLDNEVMKLFFFTQNPNSVGILFFFSPTASQFILTTENNKFQTDPNAIAF